MPTAKEACIRLAIMLAVNSFFVVMSSAKKLERYAERRDCNVLVDCSMRSFMYEVFFKMQQQLLHWLFFCFFGFVEFVEKCDCSAIYFNCLLLGDVFLRASCIEYAIGVLAAHRVKIIEEIFIKLPFFCDVFL